MSGSAASSHGPNGRFQAASKTSPEGESSSWTAVNSPSREPAMSFRYDEQAEMPFRGPLL